MAYEFKKLSDVDVVAEPIETANVLIEENGVIKKAPKTAVGGAGGDTFIINATSTNEQIPMTSSYKMVVDKTYREIMEAIEANKRVIIKMHYTEDYSDEWIMAEPFIYGGSEVRFSNTLVMGSSVTTFYAIISDDIDAYPPCYEYTIVDM